MDDSDEGAPRNAGEDTQRCQNPGKVCSLVLIGTGMTFLIPATVFLIGFQAQIAAVVGITVICLASLSILVGVIICILNTCVKKRRRREEQRHRRREEREFVSANRTPPQTAANLPRASGSFRGSLDIIRVDSFRPSEEVMQEMQKDNDPPPSYAEVVNAGGGDNDN